MAVHFLEEEAETTEAMVPAMVETDESGQGGAEKIPETDDIFTQLILQANHEAHRVEAVLQVEDKGNNIANLQGFCAGIRDFKSVANDAGFNIIPALFDTANRMTPWIVVIDNGDEEEDGDHECELDLNTLTTFSIMLDELTHSPEYITLRDKMTERIKAKKDFLYAEAERGRDLFWIHGWNKGFNWVEEQIKELHHWKEIKQQKAERRAREKASELPFDEDFEVEE